MENKSLVISFPTKKIKHCFTRELSLSTRNTLTFLRGQSFFTSGFTVNNHKGTWLFMMEEHYDRIVHCYTKLFDNTNLPFTKQDFYDWVKQALTINSNNQETLNILIVLNAGQAESYNTSNEHYMSGFGGGLSEVMVIVNKHITKPKWSFKTGINVITQSYQRPIATAKPTNYLGGVQSHFVIKAINALITLKYLTRTKNGKAVSEQWFLDQLAAIYVQYNDLAFNEREQLRICLNNLRHGYDKHSIDSNETFFALNNMQQSLSSFFDDISLTKIQANELNATEHLIYPKLIQECVFSHPSNTNILLEGSTFSLIYINQNDELVFPATDHQLAIDNSDLDNSEGKVLESTTVLSLLKIAKLYKLPYTFEKLTLDKLKSARNVLAISSTRILVESNEIELQQINSINGHKIQSKPLDDSATYAALIANLELYFHNYEYSTTTQSRV